MFCILHHKDVKSENTKIVIDLIMREFLLN